MSDAAYELKGNAAAHIDELVSISNRKGTVKTDRAGRHGAMASDGWAYRTAYFEDFNGKYYQLTISAARNASGSMVYNIGNMKEEASPKVKGSSAGNGNGPRGFASSDTSIRSAEQKSQEKFSADSSTATPQENDKTALAYFGRTYKWSETGYVLLNGARLDFSGRHEGGSGGYRSARLGIQAEIRGCEKLQRDRKIRLKSKDFSRIWSECRDSNPRPLGPEGWSDIFHGHFRAFQSLSARKISQRHPFRHG